MAQNLGQDFVLHGGIGLASDRVSKLRLDHGKRAFDVGAKVIPLQKRLSMIVVGVEHLRPQSTFDVSCVALERDQGSGSYRVNRFQVVLRRVSQVSGDFGDIKVVSCVVHKGRKQRTVVGVWAVNLNRRNDVSSHPALSSVPALVE